MTAGSVGTPFGEERGRQPFAVFPKMPTRLSRQCGPALFVIAVMSACASGGAQRADVNRYGAEVKAFRDRVDAYLALHDDIAGKLPALDETADATKLTQREAALGVAIRQARADAKRGDLFGDASPLIIQTVRRDLRRRTAQDRRALLTELLAELPAKHPAVQVNMTYPATAPLATFPPALLRDLPPLPKGIEYRFFGTHLILRDTNANLIVDVLPRMIPA